jgi:acetyl esterase
MPDLGRSLTGIDSAGSAGPTCDPPWSRKPRQKKTQFLSDLPVAEGRRTVDLVQDGDVPAPPGDITDLTVPGGPSGKVSIKIYRPKGASGVLPVLLFTHSAGWVSGGAHTYGRLVAELATRAGAAVFTNYTPSPEAKYPTGIEQIYAVLEWVAAHGGEQQLDPGRIAVAGDSVGGNMTAAITIMAKQRSGPHIAAQVLYYPVTDANFDVGSYHQFATSYWLPCDAMQWYWTHYTTDPSQRAQITASPLRATLEDITGLPPALDMVGEADPLRDEGEANPAKLRGCGGARDHGPLPGNHPRLRDGQLAARHARGQGRTAQGGEFLRAAPHDHKSSAERAAYLAGRLLPSEMEGQDGIVRVEVTDHALRRRRSCVPRAVMRKAGGDFSSLRVSPRGGAGDGTEGGW